MRDRHWEDLSHEIKFKLKPDDSLTLSKVLRLNLLGHLETIRKVVERATREDQIEVSLDKMARAWDDVMLVIEPYRYVSILVSATLFVVTSAFPVSVSLAPTS